MFIYSILLNTVNNARNSYILVTSVGGFSVLGISIFEISPNKNRRGKIANKSFGVISEDLDKAHKELELVKNIEQEELWNSLSKDTKELWKDLRNLFISERFHSRIRAMHNSKRDEGEKLIKEITRFSEKDILGKNDLESLKEYAKEFNSLDRFNVESSQKREFLKLSGAAVVGGLNAFTPGKKHQIRWKYHSVFEPNSGDILSNAMKNLSNLVNKMTNGEFIIESVPLKPADSLSSDLLLSNISDSKHEINCGIAGIYYSAKNRGLYFGTAIPFGLNSEEQTAWHEYKYEGQSKRKTSTNQNQTIMEYIYGIYGFNIKPIPLIATGHQMGGFFPKRIIAPEDLAGIKMRIPGLGGEILAKLNNDFTVFGSTLSSSAEPMPHQSKSIPELINSHKINAFEFIGPYEDKLVLEKIKRANELIYHYPGWWEPGTTFELQINRDDWEKLDRSFQGILRAACAQIYNETLANYNGS